MIFERLELMDDPQPRGAALNMAIDEALLAGVGETAILRVYRWARPAVSFGVFEEFAPVRARFPEHEWMRRWTGGGVVEHRADFTYSLIAPRSCPWAAERAEESYRLVHLAIAGVLPGAEIAREETPKVSRACFENPVRHDLLLAGRKLGGAAQRRTRRGLLHQGSIQAAAVDAGRLAKAMAGEVGRRGLDDEDFRRAEELAAAKYGTLEWLTRH